MNSVRLNNVDHADLLVKPVRGAAVGDAVNQVVVAVTELQDVQREFPILLRKDQNDDWQAVALLGFAEGENLFLEGEAWASSYVPAMLARGAFSIGLDDAGQPGQQPGARIGGEPMIHIDPDFPGVGAQDGHRLFLPQGGNAPYLVHVSRILQRLHAGLQLRQPMFDAFERHDIIEPVEIAAEASDSLQFVVKGFSAISLDRLQGLGGDALGELNRAGHLYAAHLMVASLSNIPRLIELKRRAHEAPPAG